MNMASGKLSPRERQVVELVGAGSTYKQAANHLGISINTLREHMRRAHRTVEDSSSARIARALSHKNATPRSRNRAPEFAYATLPFEEGASVGCSGGIPRTDP
jgi:DNA-binding CsgD family transcriptional regulator